MILGSSDRRRLADQSGRARQHLLSARNKYGLRWKKALDSIEEELEKTGRRLGIEADGKRVEVTEDSSRTPFGSATVMWSTHSFISCKKAVRINFVWHYWVISQY